MGKVRPVRLNFDTEKLLLMTHDQILQKAKLLVCVSLPTVLLVVILSKDVRTRSKAIESLISNPTFITLVVLRLLSLLHSGLTRATILLLGKVMFIRMELIAPRINENGGSYWSWSLSQGGRGGVVREIKPSRV